MFLMLHMYFKLKNWTHVIFFHFLFFVFFQQKLRQLVTGYLLEFLLEHLCVSYVL